MKQIVIAKYGDAGVLQVQECKDPEPSPGEVLIKVKAIGINFADILARKGLYPDAPKAPCVVGYEVSGIIEAVGQGVEQGWVRPHVDRTFLFEQAGEAHAYIEARKNIGKIVLVTGD